MVTNSRVSYPQRHLGRYLRPLVDKMKSALPRREQKIEGVADAIGVERTALHHYMAGRRLPAAKEIAKLARIPGASLDELEDRVEQDRLAAHLIDRGLEPDSFLRKARRVAQAAGLTLSELDAILRDDVNGGSGQHQERPAHPNESQ